LNDDKEARDLTLGSVACFLFLARDRAELDFAQKPAAIAIAT